MATVTTSLSVWREWIEINMSALHAFITSSLSVWREWIEIGVRDSALNKSCRLSLYGESGLKSLGHEMPKTT